MRAIYEDRSGVLWVGTWGGGLNRFNREEETFAHWVNNPENPSSLSDNSVYSIYEDRSGVLWIGTVNGLNRFKIGREKFTQWEKEPGNPDSLSHNFVLSIYEDRSGALWVGTDGGGLSRYDPVNETFTHWINEPGKPNSLSSNNVRTISGDRTGALWLGTKGGLDKFDPEKETFTHWRNEPGKPDSLSNNEILSIYEDRTGVLWIGTNGGGLNRFNREKGTFTHWINEPGNSSSLGHNAIVSIYEDRKGVLWIGTNGGGLNRFNHEDGTFTRWINEPGNLNSLSNNKILSLHEDQSGILWIGTLGGGLNKFDREEETFTRYTEKDGLPNNVIYGILEDDDGYLWLSTNKGLSKFSLQTESFRNYDIHDGLQMNEFNQGAFHKNNGKLFFGGIKGFIAFFPDNIKNNPNIPSIVITKFKKFDEIIKTNVTDTEKSVLSYKDKYFSFEFAALDYRNPDKNQYAYMMEGFDKDWIHSGTRRSATYTQLDPGEYIFRVKGSNNDGVWNEEGVSIKIIIPPPFWQTWWFRILAAMFLLGLIFIGYRKRVEYIEAQKKKLEIQVAERTKEIANKNRQLEVALRELKEAQSQLVQAQKMASLSNLAAGIAHEINNPIGAINSAANTSSRSLSRIIATLEVCRNLKEIKEDKDFTKALNILKSNNRTTEMATERISKIIKSLKNFSRLEEAEFQEADVHEGLESTLILLHHEIKNRIKVVKEFGDISKIYCYPNQLNQVFMNVLANAVQAIENKGNIIIRTSGTDSKVIISISDDGMGIKKENLKKIFDPGFTTKGVGVGAGLGLSISYNIIKTHKGDIKVNSEEGKGTEIIITLPIKQAGVPT